MTTHLPGPKDIRDLFRDLLSREVSVAPGPPVTPGPVTPCSVGVYVDDHLRVNALIACDLALSAHVAAAIALLPVAGAAAAIEDGALDGPLVENLHEVLDVAASLFNLDGATHLRLYAVHAAGGPLPLDVMARALTLGRREDLAVEVAGYGAGRFSVVLV